jgi:hypothetical protein
MDCRTARLLAEFQRPRSGELPPDEANALECHLASCPECDAAVRAERRLDEHFGPALRDVPVPDGLRERLLSRLREARLAPIRRKLAWTARGFAVAAAALIGVLIWWHTRPPKPPAVLDPEPLFETDLRKHRLHSPESVAEWYQDTHQVAMVPPPFNYVYLLEFDLVDLQGKRVPRLTFYRENEGNITRANVYVVTREQFDLGALSAIDVSQFDSFGQRLKIWPPQAQRPDTAYVIVFEGDSLDPLLPGGGPA